MVFSYSDKGKQDLDGGGESVNLNSMFGQDEDYKEIRCLGFGIEEPTQNEVSGDLWKMDCSECPYLNDDDTKSE